MKIISGSAVLVLLTACSGSTGSYKAGAADLGAAARTAASTHQIMTLHRGAAGRVNPGAHPMLRMDATSDGGDVNTGQDHTKGLQPNAGNQAPQMSMSPGGLLLSAAVIHPIYVGDYWSTAQGVQDKQWNDGFATAIGQSPIEGIIAEYGVGTSTFGGSSVVARTFTAGVNFTDSDAQQVAQAEITAGHVTREAQGIYTVIVPPGVVVDTGGGLSTDGIGGYHDVFTGTGGSSVYYAVIVNSDSSGNGIDFDGNHLDAVTITESHEWIEARTDPDISSGWHDGVTSGELGDVGIWDLDVQNPDMTYDMSRCWSRQTDGYAYQEEWSMKDSQFEVQPGATPGT